MSWDQFNQTGLTEDQYLRMVDVLKKHRYRLPRAEFSEHVFQILEDMSGLELISDSEADQIINKLWSLYHEQDS